jgi:uncharacterized protein (DUF2141 family)
MNQRTLSCVFTCLAMIPCVAHADTLLVTVNGIKAGHGNLRIAVFDEPHRNEFAEGESLRGVEVPATDEQLTVEISELESGAYAIAVFQDLNENQELDRNLMRIPKEPYGFSGSWKSGRASYDDALISTIKDGLEITINLK